MDTVLISAEVGLEQGINSLNFNFKQVSISLILLRKITDQFSSLKPH